MPRRRNEPTEIRVKRDVFPSGAPYFSVFIGNTRIGCFMPTDDGGYTLFNARTRIPSFEAAAREVIRRRVRRLRADALALSKAVELPLSADAVDPHV